MKEPHAVLNARHRLATAERLHPRPKDGPVDRAVARADLRLVRRIQVWENSK